MESKIVESIALRDLFSYVGNFAARKQAKEGGGGLPISLKPFVLEFVVHLNKFSAFFRYPKAC